MMPEQNDKTNEPSPAANKAAKDFFSEEERLLADYGQVTGLSIKRGEDWTFDSEKGVITYDPAWFQEQGFSKPDAMAATLRELEELREFRRDPRLYQRELKRDERMGFRYRILHKSLQDVLVNNTLSERAPAHGTTISDLYRTRLFPETDYTQAPKHLQFAYGILREGMLPQEETLLDPRVREAIESLKDVDGKNLIDLISEPGVDPRLRTEAIRRFIEPVFESFFEEDKQEGNTGESGEGKGKGKGQSDGQGEGGDDGSDGEGNSKNKKPKGLKPEEEDFAGEYSNFQDRVPTPMSIEQSQEIAGKMSKVSVGAGPEDADRKSYEVEHGVSWDDTQEYLREFKLVEPYVNELKKVFERIIARRIEMKRRLRARGKEGAVLDPGLLTQAKIDADAGTVDTPVWRQYEKRPVEVTAPGSFEVSLVCDLSGSMESPIDKLVQQRQCAILFMEALKDFHEMAEEAEHEMEPLSVKSEVRGFGDFEIDLKTLGPTLTELTRIAVYKNLRSAPGASTWDYESLETIENSIDDEKRRLVAEKALKKAVIVFSDGQSSNAERVQQALKRLRDLGITVVGVGITEYAAAIENTYKPDGKVCKEVKELPETLSNLLKEFAKEL